jgi:alpha-mannosidase
MPINIEGRGLEISALKKAEKENQWVVRVIETFGRRSSGVLKVTGSLTE